MEREFRNRPQGMLFFIFLFVFLFFTKGFRELFFSFFMSGSEQSKTLITILALGVTIISSEAMGYLFSTIVYFFFNFWRGYSGWFKRRLYYGNFKTEFGKLFDVMEKGKNSLPSEEFDSGLDNIRGESLFVYLFWYFDQKNENKLDTWHARRYTAFFTAWSSIIAILAAAAIAIVFLYYTEGSGGFNEGFYGWLIISLITCILMAINARDAKKVVLNTLDLWIAGITNSRFRSAVNEIHSLEKNDEIESKKSSRKCIFR